MACGLWMLCIPKISNIWSIFINIDFKIAGGSLNFQIIIHYFKYFYRVKNIFCFEKYKAVKQFFCKNLISLIIIYYLFGNLTFILPFVFAFIFSRVFLWVVPKIPNVKIPTAKIPFS